MRKIKEYYVPGMSSIEYDDVTFPYHYQFKEPCSQVKDVINDRIKLAIDNEYVDGLYEYSNAIKYLLRWPAKNGLQDLQKCKECVEKLLEHVEKCNEQQES